MVSQGCRGIFKKRFFLKKPQNHFLGILWPAKNESYNEKFLGRQLEGLHIYFYEIFKFALWPWNWVHRVIENRNRGSYNVLLRLPAPWKWVLHNNPPVYFYSAILQINFTKNGKGTKFIFFVKINLCILKIRLEEFLSCFRSLKTPPTLFKDQGHFCIF